jgi:hypothetical protein
LALFVDIQWEIFNNRLEHALKLLQLKCRERRLSYVPRLTIHGQPIPAPSRRASHLTLSRRRVTFKLLIPPPIAKLTQWDDPFLLSQEPFQTEFTKWKILEDTSESTRLARKDRRHSLICKLKYVHTEVYFPTTLRICFP